MTSPDLLKADVIRIERLRIRTADNRDLWLMTGLAELNPHFKGNSGSTALHRTLDFDISFPKWSTVDEAIAMVALADVENLNVANNALWSITDSQAFGVLDPFQSARLIRVRAGLAVRDTDGFINKVSFQVTALGLTTV